MGATYLSTDQNWQDESTVYWFTVVDTNRDINDVYGVLESGCDDQRLVGCDGAPLIPGDVETDAISNELFPIVNDMFRQQHS